MQKHKNATVKKIYRAALDKASCRYVEKRQSIELLDTS